MPYEFDLVFYARSIEADDFSTVVSSAPSMPFTGLRYTTTSISQQTTTIAKSSASNLKRQRATSDGDETESDSSHRPAKQTKTGTSPNNEPIRLHLTQPRTPQTPTGIKLRFKNPKAKPVAPLKIRFMNPAAVAKPGPLKIHLRNPAAQPKLKPRLHKPEISNLKVWFFKNVATGKWDYAAANEHNAAYRREPYMCAKWIATLLEPQEFEAAAPTQQDEMDWGKDVFRWSYELSPEDALGE
jgi:hypothetical protein